MLSLNYKERFTAEYEQLSIRASKLEIFLDNYRHSRLSFKPICSIELLERQLDIMKAYIAVLEERAKIEGVNVR
jgi:hypothetical protein